MAQPQPCLLCVLLLEQLSVEPVMLCCCFLQGSNLDLCVLPQQELSLPRRGLGVVLAVKEVGARHGAHVEWSMAHHRQWNWDFVL